MVKNTSVGYIVIYPYVSHDLYLININIYVYISVYIYVYIYISTSQYETMVQTCATCYVPYQKRQRIWIVNSPCSFKLVYKSDYSLYIPIMSPLYFPPLYPHIC